jgi:hypothetical protein
MNHRETWQPPRSPAYGGETFDPTADTKRLNRQCLAVFNLMRDRAWRTPEEIESAIGVNWASASARLRDLRKPQFGAFQIDRQRKGDAAKGLFQYRLRPPAPRQPDLFDETDKAAWTTTSSKLPAKARP